MHFFSLTHLGTLALAAIKPYTQLFVCVFLCVSCCAQPSADAFGAAGASALAPKRRRPEEAGADDARGGDPSSPAREPMPPPAKRRHGTNEQVSEQAARDSQVQRQRGAPRDIDAWLGHAAADAADDAQPALDDQLQQAARDSQVQRQHQRDAAAQIANNADAAARREVDRMRQEALRAVEAAALEEARLEAERAGHDPMSCRCHLVRLVLSWWPGLRAARRDGPLLRRAGARRAQSSRYFGAINQPLMTRWPARMRIHSMLMVTQW